MHSAIIEVTSEEFAVLLVGLALIAVDPTESLDHKQRANALIDKLLKTHHVTEDPREILKSDD